MLSRLPTDEEIRERAYQLYLEGGRESGHDLADWVAARMELVIKLTASLAVGKLDARDSTETFARRPSAFPVRVW
jgi:hypothetical protein